MKKQKNRKIVAYIAENVYFYFQIVNYSNITI